MKVIIVVLPVCNISRNVSLLLLKEIIQALSMSGKSTCLMFCVLRGGDRHHMINLSFFLFLR